MAKQLDIQKVIDGERIREQVVSESFIGNKMIIGNKLKATISAISDQSPADKPPDVLFSPHSLRRRIYLFGDEE